MRNRRHRLSGLLSAAAIAVVGAAVAALTACSPPPSPLTPLTKDAVIIALGDSLTYGTGGQGTSYPQVLQMLTGKTVINAGIPGETSRGAAARVGSLLRQHPAQLLIVCTGGNDLLRRQSDEVKANLSRIVETAQAAGVPVVLIAVPRPIPFPLNHPVYAEVAAEYRLWLEDDILKTVLHDNALKSDQIHANTAGYREIGAAVAALLQRAGALPS